MQKGYIKYNGAKLEEHEKSTLNFLSENGYNIEVIQPQNTPKMKNADIVIDGVVWEMKCSQGYSERGIERLFVKAKKQSSRIIIDLRLTKIDKIRAMNRALKEFEKRREIRSLMVISEKGIDKYNKK